MSLSTMPNDFDTYLTIMTLPRTWLIRVFRPFDQSVSTTSQPRNYTDDEYLSSKYRPPQMPTPSSTGGRRSPSAQSHMQAFSRAPSDSQSTFFAAAGPSSDQRTGVPGTGYSRAGEGWDNRGAMSPGRLPPWTRAHDSPSSASGPGLQVQSPRSSGHLRQASAPQTASTPASTNIRSSHHSRSASTSNPRNSDYPQHQPLQNVASSSSAVRSGELPNLSSLDAIFHRALPTRCTLLCR